MRFLRKLAAEPMLTLAAICFGAFVVVADRVLTGTMLDRPPDFSEPVVLVINGVLVAAPFVWLAYRGSKRLIPWTTGMTLTLWLWWRFLQDGVAYQRAPDGSGVDMAFGRRRAVRVWLMSLCARIAELFNIALEQVICC